VRCLPFACLCLSLALISSGCTKRRDTPFARDACSLVSKEEVESVQQIPVKGAKSSERSDGTFRISQCLYTAAEFSKSVNLDLIQADPNEPGKRSPKDFWKEKLTHMKTRNPKKIATARRKKDLRRKGSLASEMRLIGPAIDSAERFMC
jgi:hypothetical protein